MPSTQLGAERCKACDRPIGAGPAGTFKQFVDHFAPNTTTRDRAMFYSRRSAITHGDKLLLGDEVGWGISVAGSFEDAESRDLATIVRTVLRNWLHSGA